MRNKILAELNQLVAGFTKLQTLLLLTMLAKKAKPNYNDFCRKHKTGNMAFMKRAVVTIENAAKTNESYTQNHEETVQRIKQYTPDTDEFEGTETLGALDACVCLLNAYAYYKTENTKYITQTFETLLDGVQMQIEIENNLAPDIPNLELTVYNNTKMKKTIKQIKAKIKSLR